MGNNQMQPFKWTPKKEKAALLIAQDTQSDSEIADSLDVNKATLERWKRHPEFLAKAQAHVEEMRQAIKRKGITEKQNRLDVYNTMVEKLLAVVTERGEEMEDETAGGKTGILVRQYKSVGVGKDAELVREYAVDTGLLKEIREYAKQAAQEMGEWTEKKELTGKDGESLIPVKFTLVLNNDDSDSD